MHKTDKYVFTCAVLVDLDGSVVELTQSLYLYVVTMRVVHALAIQVRVKVFRHILLEKVLIFCLQHIHNILTSAKADEFMKLIFKKAHVSECECLGCRK